VNLIKPASAASVVLFVWTALSWMLLPWHEAAIAPFPVEEPIRQALTGAPAGIYLLPDPKKVEQNPGQPVAGPHVFAAVSPTVQTSMAPMMGAHFVFQFLASLLAVWIAAQIPSAGFWRIVCVFSCFGAISSLAALLPFWNWWSFTSAYVGGEVADQLAGWTLAGLAAGRLIRRSSPENQNI
jgi:hypothetical protein